MLDTLPSGPVAIYCRVSSDEQAERGNIETQREFLRNYTKLYAMTVADEYLDDGVTGRLPLHERPQGARLCADVERGRISAVLVYRLDRLARSLHVLLDAHAKLDSHSTAIRSATEPCDTGSPMGKFVFQLLGSMAELERSTIAERMTSGRDRYLRQGQWLQGPVPFGYDLDEHRCLIPSEQLVPHLNKTEAQIVREMFQRIADGGTCLSEAVRLNALEVPTTRRYANGKTHARTPHWPRYTVYNLLRNPVYKGTHVIRAKTQAIEREVPPLISLELWDRVQARLLENKSLPTYKGRPQALLAGKLRCTSCGKRFSLCWRYGKKGQRTRYYRCNGQLMTASAPATCHAKVLRAEPLEEDIWAALVCYAHQPEEVRRLAFEQFIAALSPNEDTSQERDRLRFELRAKLDQRERVKRMAMRGDISLEESSELLGELAREQALAEAELTRLTDRSTLVEAHEARWQRVERHILEYGPGLEQAPPERRREVLDAALLEIEVTSDGAGRTKTARLRRKWAFAELGSSAVVEGGPWITTEYCL
jgi:site-specific DNA recombinase